jgi:hypothetical protein
MKFGLLLNTQFLSGESASKRHHFIFRVQWPGMSQEDALGQIAQLGREVVQRTRSSEPRLRNGASISAGPKG